MRGAGAGRGAQAWQRRIISPATSRLALLGEGESARSRPAGDPSHVSAADRSCAAAGESAGAAAGEPLPPAPPARPSRLVAGAAPPGERPRRGPAARYSPSPTRPLGARQMAAARAQSGPASRRLSHAGRLGEVGGAARPPRPAGEVGGAAAPAACGCRAGAAAPASARSASSAPEPARGTRRVRLVRGDGRGVST